MTPNDSTRAAGLDLGADLQATIMQLQDLQERFQYELQFAEQLCMWHPDEAGDWRGLMAEAAPRVAAALATGNVDTARAAISAAEQSLSPIAHVAKTYTIYCAGHGHIDMNWMWSFDETVSITLDTCRTMLDLMDQYPDYTFAQSQASVYEIVARHDPALLERIRDRVQEGRWEVTAATWVEADRNLPNAESMVRHLLYTRRYLSGLLGIDPDSLDLDFEPDTFGHHQNVPEILSDAGVRYYYHCRGSKYMPPPARCGRPGATRHVLVAGARRLACSCAMTCCTAITASSGPRTC